MDSLYELSLALQIQIADGGIARYADEIDTGTRNRVDQVPGQIRVVSWKGALIRPSAVNDIPSRLLKQPYFQAEFVRRDEVCRSVGRQEFEFF